MKKYIFFLLAVGATATACYDDYVKDYEDQAIYFPYQTDVRTVVVGEGMQFKTGVNLAGVISNGEDRVVNFTVDPSLVNDETLTAMKNHTFSYIKTMMSGVVSLFELPSDEYALSPASQTVIRKGEHLGSITIRVDSARFLSDVSRTSPVYVIPLRITEVSSTRIFEPKATEVIGVRYDNMLFGHYWHGGQTIVRDGAGTVINTIDYFTTVPQSDSRVWTLTTVSPFTLTANAVGNEANGSTPQLSLTLDHQTGAVTVGSVSGAKYAVTADGDSKFNRARLLQDRRIFLKYQYQRDGNTYHATDTLTFRNRIRDGVNEWQDENP